MAVVFKDCITLPMPCAIGIPLPDWLRRGRPNDTDVIISDVNGGPERIADRAVEPRREAIVLAIAASDKIGARLRNQRTKLRIGPSVDPRKRHLQIRLQLN